MFNQNAVPVMLGLIRFYRDSLYCLIFFFLCSLCRRKSNRITGRPFRPVSATPIDLFPHTPHCELVVLLERVSEQEEVGLREEVGSCEEARSSDTGEGADKLGEED